LHLQRRVPARQLRGGSGRSQEVLHEGADPKGEGDAGRLRQVHGGPRHLTGPPDVDALLTAQAEPFGDRIYLESLDPPGCLTFAELDAGCHRIAHFLAKHGVRANERVTLLADNSPAFVMLFFGVLRYGATVNPLNAEALGPDLGRILYDVDPRLIL